jgi:hypothetical protein
MPDTPIFQNAFQSVRPRGVDRPSAAPAKKGAGKPPLPLAGSHVRVLDCNGQARTTLAPRKHDGFLIESRAQAQASQDKRNALVKGGL